MYEERKEKFSFKSFFLTLLLVLLFVFLMLWIFPTRWEKSDLQSTYDLERLSVLYDEIFANNVSRMKDAAIGYFTNERMPQTVGESKKLTLREMYDLHLVLKMKDKDGKECDSTKSYVEMTKYTEEYRLKVNLSCGDIEDYIIVYLGCYNYCSGGICEKRVSTPSEITYKEEKKQEVEEEKYYCKVVNGKYYDNNGFVVDKDTYDNACSGPIPIKRRMYEYKLETSDTTTCTDWSDWQKDPITPSDTISVVTKTKKEVKGYKTVTIQIGTKEEIKTTPVTEKYISKYTTKLVETGTKKIQTGTTTKEETKKVKVGTVEKYAGIDFGETIPDSTSTTRYEVIGSTTQSTCSNCEEQTVYTWKIWNIEDVYDVVTETVEVPVYKNIKTYEEQEIPVYEYKVVDKEEKIFVPIYEERQLAEYHDVLYYKYKTCTFKAGTTDVKWSYNEFDADLISKGYKLTGNVKEI